MDTLLKNELNIFNSTNVPETQTDLLNQDRFIHKNYNSKLKLFLKQNKITTTYYNYNINWQFRYFCYRYTDYIKNIDLPMLEYENKYEAVFIEFRILPNIEFLLRNSIEKLGESWSQTIVCGNLNYNFLKLLISTINRKIKVIKLDYNSIDINTYNLILTNISFWENFKCDRVLIYQEDSIIIKKNIMDFINYSYIGAPWASPNVAYLNKKMVGNGGFSLRDPKVMIDVINTIDIYDFSRIYHNKDNKQLKIYPEDVYFANNIINFNLGTIPDKNIAKKFSSEQIFDPECLGGHQLWLNNKNWKEFLKKKIII